MTTSATLENYTTLTDVTLISLNERPETWVTVCTGHMGEYLARTCLAEASMPWRKCSVMGCALRRFVGLGSAEGRGDDGRLSRSPPSRASNGYKIFDLYKGSMGKSRR